MTHIQVLLKHNIVIAELVFLDHDAQVMADTFAKFDYNQLIDLSLHNLTPGGLGSAWNGTSFMPQPFPSWTLDNTFHWQPPKPKPDGDYQWNEPTQQWKLTITPEDET